MKRRHLSLKVLVIFILVLFMILTLTTMALCAGGDGSGGGGGGGTAQPLSLVSVTIEDGSDIRNATGVPLRPKITFKFDKNVVSMTYWEKNVSCFRLTDSKGNSVTINVTKIDDTVDFSARQNIWVQPADEMTAGTTYTLFVAPDLMAKNGMSTLGMTTNNQGVIITFTTAGEAPAVNVPPLIAPSSTSTQPSPSASSQPVVASPSAEPSVIVSPLPGNAPAEASVSPSETPSPSVSPSESPISPSATSASPAFHASPDASSAPQAEASSASASKPANIFTLRNSVASIAILAIAVWIIIEIVRRRGKKK